MAEFLGCVHWYDLLCRPKLSCYSEVYGFTRAEPQHAENTVPASVLDELLTSVALSAWLSVPLHREFAPFVLATDASTDFGFGGCVADTSPEEARAISRQCTQTGASATLETDGARPDTATKYHRLSGVRKGDFKTVFSIRAKRKAHINLLETSALNIGLEWVLRNPRRHHQRIVVLLDSKVAIGGAAKGRSSSKPLLRELRRTAALVLAGSIQPHYVHVGTKDNPADEPSRGIQHRPRVPRCVQRLRQQLPNGRRAHQRLVACGHLQGPSSDSNNSSV